MAKKNASQQTKDIQPDEKTTLDTLTERGLFSETVGTIVQENFSKVFGERNVKPIHEFLKTEGKKINNGNLESAERILITQAHTLDSIFNCLAIRASRHDEVELFESLMRLAFKAQSQCRTTLETLANVKNPPHVAFVKQANIGHNQQINNAAGIKDKLSRAQEIKNQQTQLLENNHDERLDIGTKSSSIEIDKELETVGKIHRTNNKRR